MPDQSSQQENVAPAHQPGAAPVPRPGPKPHPMPRRPAASAPAPAAHHVDPHKFGRVDDDGSVWLITSAGERQIGSWQAGDADAAYTHFGRRFEDLETEIQLLELRLGSGSGDARKIKTAAEHLAETLPTASVLGDVDSLSARLTALLESADAQAAAARVQRDEARSASISRKEELAAEAEEIANNSTQWKAAGDRIRVILDEWKSIHGVDRKTDDALWKRYSAARETFNRRRGAHFAELDRERAGAREKKEDLCKQAEALSDSTDWGATAGAFRNLLNDWKAAGRAPRETDDNLWHRFKAAQDKFFAARNAESASRDAEFVANADAKRALLVEAEKIDPETDVDGARAALRAIGDKWDAIGKVPREQQTDLERRLRAIEKKVRDAGESGWGDPEAEARAEQFRVRARQFEEQAAKAEVAGKTKDAEKARASAKQWQEWADAAVAAVKSRSR
ncbi:hypothetical protein CCUG62472_04522 [Mycobacteroides salmoniphilum]|uniref:DNA repair ATPase n=2 Tax=Mycobacteroides salmoniphilum TaxID=404941 RepID=A0A4R8SQ37_9MYCO|nr:hypothetical protein CCUG62472_04522 [Mycobacteroides salmoniphilum]TEA01139.1 hypothetical protein CCUG60884_03888 [Mycobacteroides salmoniphilum]